MKIVVDSSVWIDHLADRDTLQTRTLALSISRRDHVIVCDLVMAEVLQGTRDARDFARVHARLTLFDALIVSDMDLAAKAARNYQALRQRGITIRKTIDTLIATRCILDRLPLLYSDRDFDPFVEHLGLIPAIGATSGVI